MERELNFADAVFEDAAAPVDSRPTIPPAAPKKAAVGLGSRVSICPLSHGLEGPPVAVTIQTMSTRGVCLLIDSRLSAGSDFVLLMPRQGSPLVELLCCVEKCEIAEKNRTGYTVTASFKKILSRR